MHWALALSTLPMWQSMLLVVGLGMIFGMAGPVAARRLWGLDRLKINNEVGGFKFAVIGGVYAVTLGFATIVVWEKYRDAESAVMQEAAAISALDRLMNPLDQASAHQIRAQLRTYDRAVVDDEWPTMRVGRSSPLVSKALDGLYASVLAQVQQGSQDNAILQAQLTQLNSLTQARRERLDLASGIVPGIVWLVLVSGAIVTVGFTDAELIELDRYVRDHTANRFGPVREVAHGQAEGLVLEIAFEGLNRSSRHKSGVAMRFPRIARIRWDKPAREADRIESLEALLG